MSGFHIISAKQAFMRQDGVLKIFMLAQGSDKFGEGTNIRSG